MTPQTAVMSELLCDLPDAPAEAQTLIVPGLLRALRLVNRDEADTEAAGYTETCVDAWYAGLNGGTR